MVKLVGVDETDGSNLNYIIKLTKYEASINLFSGVWIPMKKSPDKNHIRIVEIIFDCVALVLIRGGRTGTYTPTETIKIVANSH